MMEFKSLEFFYQIKIIKMVFFSNFYGFCGHVGQLIIGIIKLYNQKRIMNTNVLLIRAE